MSNPPTPRPSVIDLLHQRRREGSQPGQRSDPYRVALAIEGGAMRGVVSAGMVCALDQLRLQNSFDAVYGSSAGAINGAFFLSRQTNWGIRIYYTDINNPRFVNYTRALAAPLLPGVRPMVDVDFAITEVLHNRRRLDFNAVLASPVPLLIVASSVTSNSAAVLSNFTSVPDLVQGLTASAKMPGIAGPPVAFRGQHLCDSLVFERFPLQTVIDAGFTHILVLLSKAREIESREGWIETTFIGSQLRGLGSAFQDAYRKSHAKYKSELARLVQLESDPHSPVAVASIAPSVQAPDVHRLETRRGVLHRAARMAYGTTLLAFGYSDTVVVDVIKAFTADGRAVGQEA